MTETAKRRAMPAARLLPPLPSRHALILAVGCALMLRILIPAGWMPIADAHGLRIVLCGGTGPVEAQVDHAAEGHHPAAHHKKSDDRTSHTDQPCAFAGMALPWTGTDLAALPLPFALAALASPLAAELVAIGRGLAAPPPPPTGPPAPF